jgi:predicted nuclease of predicted toxin-antitoxin system
MKFLIHVQSPRRLAHQLRAAGFEAIHTLDLPQGNRTTDQEVITFSLVQYCAVVESFLLMHEPWKLLLVSTGNIGNDELLRLFQLNIEQLAESFKTFDFIELNRTCMICHL